MKLFNFNYKCEKCGFITKAPGLDDLSYAEFVMFNNSGNCVYLNFLEDSVVSEYELIFKKMTKSLKNINDEKASYIFQNIFSLICDVSEDGSRYNINQFPPCMNCGSKNMASWSKVYPDELSGEIKSPTHQEWSKLSIEEKEFFVKTKIINFSS